MNLDDDSLVKDLNQFINKKKFLERDYQISKNLYDEANKLKKTNKIASDEKKNEAGH